MNMKHRYRIWFFVLALCAAYGRASGDDYASNIVYIKPGPYGRYYAKAIPDEPYGSKGVTKIYVVGEGEDKLMETYPWYSQVIDLQHTLWGMSVVRIGTCRSAQEVSKDDLAIGLYLSGKTLREYSTLDVALAMDDSGARSRYCRYPKILGYRSIGSNEYVLDVEIGGKTLSFDTKTGEPLRDPKTK
jgi:hypothetical protein